MTGTGSGALTGTTGKSAAEAAVERPTTAAAIERIPFIVPTPQALQSAHHTSALIFGL